MSDKLHVDGSSLPFPQTPTASFAGQHETYLHIRGDEMLLDLAVTLADLVPAPARR